jgi:chromosome segregation ATPase
MISDTVLVSVISTIGGVAIAYIVNVAAKRRKANKPKDRMQTIFDGYEALIKQQQSDIDRKQLQLKTTQDIIDRLQRELDDTREIVRQQRKEMEDTKEANIQLIEQLNTMKQHYDDEQKADVVK